MGGWEILDNVLVCTLTREIVTTKWANNYRNLMVKGGTCFLSGMPFDHARNEGVRKLLQSELEWLFFLDDDVCVPPDVIYRLMAHNKAIVSGVYFRRNSPILPCAMRMNDKGSYEFINSYNRNSLEQVDLVGAGCLLIHRSVFEKMGTGKNMKWFEWMCDNEELPPTERVSEDFAFMKRATKLGYGIFLDTSIQCEHVGLSASSESGLNPAVIG